MERFTDFQPINDIQNYIDLKKNTLQNPLYGIDKFATGTVFGLCSGYAARKAFRFGALVLGAGFISLQALQYYGYITIEWKAIEKELTSALDINKDGHLDEKDIALAKQKMMDLLTWGLPSAGGFSTGFLLGLRGHFF